MGTRIKQFDIPVFFEVSADEGEGQTVFVSVVDALRDDALRRRCVSEVKRSLEQRRAEIRGERRLLDVLEKRIYVDPDELESPCVANSVNRVRDARVCELVG